ncbi:MAG: SUMF1/EgtB/PvdO family nonheme iron enzyme [Acidobacteriia bacterium]|nr:SUMF1/EgtB/PvdO family nonheme iron enzyme [Terriglobia bacterium]
MATCTVFISSTSEDLKGLYRNAVRTAAEMAGFRVVGMESFGASERPPVHECLARVKECDVVVVVVAHRYGWVPEQEDGGTKSITWIECEYALQEGKAVLAFVVDPGTNWPAELKDSYRGTVAIEAETDTPELIAGVKRDVRGLKAFKEWLDSKTMRTLFKNPDDLRAEVLSALHRWLDRNPRCKSREPVAVGDPAAYLKWLREQTGTIDIRGFGVGSGKVHHFPIEDLYIPLTTAGGPGEEQVREWKPMDLREALEHRRLVVVGDPGSGKSTFLKRITYGMAGDALGGGGKFPMLIKVADLIGYMQRYPRQAGPEAAQWLVHCLKDKSEECGWGLNGEFFSGKLTGGSGVVLLDGLDEAADRTERETVARLVENATGVYRDCQFVVTTRPGAYQGLALLKDFHEASIDPLEPDMIETFLDHWCQTLYTESVELARDHRKELSDALGNVPEIRRMARNPVMLTALAVVHYNQAHLPEQRAELYDSILTWLARARKDKPGREKPDRCLVLFRELALKMQNHPDGRQRRVGMGWAAECLAPEFTQAPDRDRKTRAIQFLEEETTDSGIIVSRGGQIEFWHLTFQEYLAALAINGRGEAEQIKLLLERDEKIYLVEWREVALLLAGILGKQGKEKVDWLVSEMLGRTPSELPKQARTAGLIGSMVRDLQPIAYEPKDPGYAQLLGKVMAIFEKGKTKGIDLKTRVGAAEALDQANPSRRLRTPGQEDYWVKTGKFRTGKFPVTVWEYGQYLGDKEKAEKPPDWDEQVLHLSRPVTNVTWHNAQHYCEWASGKWNMHCGLPSEEQWEFAARGAESRVYPWGPEEPDEYRANFNMMVGEPTPVGMFPDGYTPEGVADMVGNVWEWTRSDYDKESKGVRGASFDDVSSVLGAAVRGRVEPGDGYSVIGFRCVRE